MKLKIRYGYRGRTCSIDEEDGTKVCKMNELGGDFTKRNSSAEYIVKAVSNYEELLEALDVAMSAVTAIYNMQEASAVKYIGKVDNIACDAMTRIGEINEKQDLLKQIKEQ